MQNHRHRSDVLRHDFHCLDSKISLISKSVMSRLWLASVADQAGSCLTWAQGTMKTRFLVFCDESHLIFVSINAH